MPNSLSRTAGLQLGPTALEILLRHYFDRVKKENAKDGLTFTQLRQDELLYDEAFSIGKRFFHVASQHTIEELQAFLSTRTPSPPWVHVLRVTVPLSCCDEAAILLIQALGGEEHASLLVGGTKWWQVRGAPGVAGEWLTAKKDWGEAKKRQKAFQKMKNNSGFVQDTTEILPPSMSEPSSIDDKGVDDMRCILFAHGGGYCFGSIDQERHCVQRLARKTKGRVFAINYRLAPQYPFPCALQDLVAAYLYLIKPPPDASHQPMKPSHIVVAGDSAGGGLTLALLQVLRDTSQPLPAGGILISPWCDLMHSFPSIRANTATDVMPSCGLSLWKPSALWPPPSEEMTRKIHTGLRRKIRQIVRVTVTGDKTDEATAESLPRDVQPKPGSEDGASLSSDRSTDVGADVSGPSGNERGEQTVCLVAKTGEQLRIDSQMQLYTRNSLLAHPLVSPALSYLGGLPPLFVIAGDKEVLRDEIIYSAHKAGEPSKFPLHEEARALYPPLVGIEERYGPTQVHVQVYDDVAHDLPVLFPFTTPAKYCYRAMATFTKHVTGMLRSTGLTLSSSEVIGPALSHQVSSPLSEDLSVGSPIQRVSSPLSGDLATESLDFQGELHVTPDTTAPVPDSTNLHPPLSSRSLFFSFQTKSVRPSMSRPITLELPSGRDQKSFSRLRRDQNVGSPGEIRRKVSTTNTTNVCYAGEPSVYYNEEGLLSWKEGMIRERVSTRGIIRPLEPADELEALQVSPSSCGVPPEDIMRRYLEGKALSDRKFAKELLAIERKRNRNIDLSKKDITRNLTLLQESQNGRTPGKSKETPQASRDEQEFLTGAWGWALADERPPPSSIVSRRDTDESRRLARIADQSILQDEVQTNGTGLWAVIVGFLATSPPKEHPASDSEAAGPPVERMVLKKSKSVFASLRASESSS